MNRAICVIASGGGHLKEAKLAFRDLEVQPHFYVTNFLPHLAETLKSEKVFFIVDPSGSFVKYFINVVQTAFIYAIMRPSIIITTGAGMVIPMCIIGKFFGSEIIFIESGARVIFPSRTGLFLYRFSDCFIIQSEELQKYYPRAIVKRGP